MDRKISVIIPAFNEERYIADTLRSVEQQDYQNYEIIIVANGCTDKTEEIVRENSSDKIRLFSIPKPHVSRARNYGASKAAGDILFFLDADTLLESSTLRVVAESFRNGYAVATTKVFPDDQKFRYKLAMSFKNFYNSSKIYKGCSGALICTKEHFENVNGYDPDIIVKEHKKLTNKLLQHGKYAVLDTSVITSMRRLKNWGLWKSTSFWVRKWCEDKFGKLEQSKYEEVR